MQYNKTQRPVYLNLLQIKLPVTGILSILHRLTGVLMVFSLPFLVYLLDLSLNNRNDFDAVVMIFSHPLMKVLLGIYLWFLAHHLMAGIRFLLLDLDLGVEKDAARRSAFIVNYLGLILFVVILYGVFSV
ncbi:MAG: succinate dehydrogenase, cytochrome b556 subunit [Gammaproteobacteria bacterium]|nr:succinate dehydrogenase, cytochrome b556 subunit [Gammaproteobacteria bacterium]